MDNYDLASGPKLSGSRGQKSPSDLMRSMHVGSSLVQCEDCRVIRHEHHDGMTRHERFCTDVLDPAGPTWLRTVIPYAHTRS
jgi:hypothetical protein